MGDRKLQRWLVAGVLLMIASFHLSTLREGHPWGDDFALYLLHARNIALGLPYTETGYIVNPDQPSLGPAAYPPMLPLMMAAVYRLPGSASLLAAFKVEMVLFLLAALTAIWSFFRLRLGWGNALAVMALVGFNPFIWEFKDSIAPDFLFLALTYVSLCSMQSLHGAGLWRPPLLGGLMYLAFATRSLGGVLLPALVLVEYGRNRRLSVRAAVSLSVGAGLILMQNTLLPVEHGYLSEFHATFTWKTPFVNAWGYFREASGIWENNYTHSVTVIIFLASCAWASRGLWKQRRNVTVLECFLPLYLGVVLCWPSEQGLRYLLPVVPALFAYLCLASTARIWIAVLAVAFLGYGANYSRKQFGPMSDGITLPEFQRLCEFVVRNTSPQDRFLFRKPRAFAWLTGRSAAVYSEEAGVERTWEFIRGAGLTHVIVANIANRDFRSDRTFLQPLVQLKRARLEEAYANSQFTLFKIAAMPPSGQPGLR